MPKQKKNSPEPPAASQWDTNQMPSMAPPQLSSAPHTDSAASSGLPTSQLRPAAPLQLADDPRKVAAILAGLSGQSQEEEQEQEEDQEVDHEHWNNVFGGDSESDDDEDEASDADMEEDLEGVRITAPESLWDQIGVILSTRQGAGFRATLRRLAGAKLREVSIEYTNGSRTWTQGTQIFIQRVPPQGENPAHFYPRAIDYEMRNVINSIGSMQSMLDGILAASNALGRQEEKKSSSSRRGGFGHVGQQPSLSSSSSNSSSSAAASFSGKGGRSTFSALDRLAASAPRAVDPRIAARRAVKTELQEMANALEQYLDGDDTYEEFFDGDCLDIAYWFDNQIASGHTRNYDPQALSSNDNWLGLAMIATANETTLDFGNDAEGVRILREVAQELQ